MCSGMMLTEEFLLQLFHIRNPLHPSNRLHCGRLNGFQSIHRAELVAVVILCEYFTEFTAFTDSVDVIHKVALCRRTTEAKELAGFADFDLLIRLHATLTPEKQILKTKATLEKLLKFRTSMSVIKQWEMQQWISMQSRLAKSFCRKFFMNLKCNMWTQRVTLINYRTFLR